MRKTYINEMFYFDNTYMNTLKNVNARLKILKILHLFRISSDPLSPKSPLEMK